MVRIRNPFGLVNKEMKQKENVRSLKEHAVGIAILGVIGVTVCIMIVSEKGIELQKICKRKTLDAVEKTKDNIKDKADAVHDAVEHASKVASKAINSIDNNSNELHEDIKEGYHDIKNDIDKTVENISSDLKKAER